MKVGDRVILKDMEYNRMPSRGAGPGATATVVDGSKEFAGIYTSFMKTYTDHAHEFIWVRWDKDNPNYRWAEDGLYSKYTFDLIGKDSFNFKGKEPNNNDGREECFWCKCPTVKKMGFTDHYNICPKCKK